MLLWETGEGNLGCQVQELTSVHASWALLGEIPRAGQAQGLLCGRRQIFMIRSERQSRQRDQPVQRYWGIESWNVKKSKELRAQILKYLLSTLRSLNFILRAFSRKET